MLTAVPTCTKILHHTYWRRYEGSWDGLHYFLPYLTGDNADGNGQRCAGGIVHMMVQVLFQSIFAKIPANE